MIKLIVTDMDGTLLDDKKRLPPDFWQVVDTLHQHGVLFCVASGRQYYTLDKIFERAKGEIAFIAENGAYVVNNDEVLHEDVIQPVDAVRIIKRGRTIENAHLIVCCKNGAYVESTDDEFLKVARQHYYKLDIVDDLTRVDDLVLKITSCDFSGSERNSAIHFGEFSSDFMITVSGEIWLDIVNRSVNKGAALRRLQQKFGISYDETVVFGDYLNDLEMMRDSKFSYAMKNAHADIVSAAANITSYDNNDAGVTVTIKELFPEINW